MSVEVNYLTVHSVADAEALTDKVRAAADYAQEWLLGQIGDPLGLFRQMKFEPVGFHPISHGALNLVEQINQTWTFLVAIAAAKQLLMLHPEAGGFRIAPGAHASLPLDIMSEVEGLVGAETFAAVSPRNNDKLQKDLGKLQGRIEKHRYVFFLSPLFPGTARRPQFESGGIQVWSVDV
ncbi:hypothetical protein [Methylocystis sp.]|uniref:hypothetical protein n=1 Tax=Methylocystis sp. TaxID=1911079 RepID=UPI0025DBA0BC|nr:hypothetical protein [Methylocystis sp.]